MKNFIKSYNSKVGLLIEKPRKEYQEEFNSVPGMFRDIDEFVFISEDDVPSRELRPDERFQIEDNTNTREREVDLRASTCRRRSGRCATRATRAARWRFVARARAGAGGRHALRRRGLHQPHPGPPRLPPRHGGVLRGQAPAVRRAVAGGRQRRRPVRPAAGDGGGRPVRSYGADDDGRRAPRRRDRRGRGDLAASR